MERHHDLIHRLRSLADEPVPAALEAAHLAGIDATAQRPRLFGARIVAAAAALVLVAGGTALATVGQDGSTPVSVTGPASPPGLEFGPDQAEPPGEGKMSDSDFQCTGPPPFAGEPTESEEARIAEAEAFDAWRAENCPAEDGTEDGAGGLPPGAGVPGEPADPFPVDPCKGPPPFAGETPESGEQRAAEAAAFSQTREACPETDDGEGPPPGTPDGPPEGAGPPAGTLDGPPDGENP